MELCVRGKFFNGFCRTPSSFGAARPHPVSNRYLPALRSRHPSLARILHRAKSTGNDNQSSGSDGQSGVSTSPSSGGIMAELPSWGVWALLGCYLGWVYLSTGAPGNPAYQTSPETIQEFIHESVSLWYINPILSNFNISILPDFPEHPVAEALFTFIVTWDVMMWPAMVADKQGVGVKYKRELWYGSLGLLTAFLMPYMALRLSKSNREQTDEIPELPSYSPAFGWFGLVIFGASVAWILFARPEFGDLSSRIDFAVTRFNSERVFYALSIDCLLYSVFQFALMEGAPLKYRLLPYVGLGLWLTEGKTKE
ncbi:hypothetical protein BSKO_07454 [Bryopsis sp. KO-2023]|nr:hypothetical protein BSKO_07454 [Bryopsis sp. KO-2023]